MQVHGIHHITAIASDPQVTYDFYTKVLGLRLLKKSVNQDDVQTYHLFFGDKMGEPGMDLTFFTFQPAMQGKRGVGQVTLISLSVAEESFAFWEERFTQHGVRHEKIIERFGKKRLVFYDRDDQRLELVAAPVGAGGNNVWTTKEVGREVAIRSFYAARLDVTSLALVEPVLVALGYTRRAHEEQIVEYVIEGKERAVVLEIEQQPEARSGLSAAGTVHHIAFEVSDEEEQLAMREKILALGLYPTPVINRFYFKSVYFRIPAGILFELATSGPGFTADEPEADLGKKLALPPFLEDRRDEIEANLPPFRL